MEYDYESKQIDKILAHFPEDINELNQEIKEFAEEHAFAYSRYIWVTDRENRMSGYCSHCHKTINKVRLPRHNEIMTCPNCKTDAIVKHEWRGHGSVIDKTYFHYFEKSRINPQAIICYGIYGVKDYTGNNYLNPKTYYEIHSFYVFEPGNSQMMKLYSWSGSFQLCKSVYPRFINYAKMRNINFEVSIESIKKAVAGTSFQYSEWEKHERNCNCGDGFVRYFDLYSKYPIIECLSKIGLWHLIESRLEGHPTLNALNFRGKTIYKALKMNLNKNEMKELTKLSESITFNSLKIMQLAKREKEIITFNQIKEIDFYNNSFEQLKVIKEYISFQKIFNYFEKQMKQMKKEQVTCDGINRTKAGILSDWRDYINDCKTLGFDLTQKGIVCPTSLDRAHQNTMKQVQHKENKLLDLKIRKRYKQLDKNFSYQDEKYIIKPVSDTWELICEGKALNHCVGTYAKRYAEGKTNILIIREKTKQDTPFYTMEISNNGNIVQVRGKRNCAPTKELQKFIDNYKNQLQPGRKTA